MRRRLVRKGWGYLHRPRAIGGMLLDVIAVSLPPISRAYAALASASTRSYSGSGRASFGAGFRTMPARSRTAATTTARCRRSLASHVFHRSVSRANSPASRASPIEPASKEAGSGDVAPVSEAARVGSEERWPACSGSLGVPMVKVMPRARQIASARASVGLCPCSTLRIASLGNPLEVAEPATERPARALATAARYSGAVPILVAFIPCDKHAGQFARTCQRRREYVPARRRKMYHGLGGSLSA